MLNALFALLAVLNAPLAAPVALDAPTVVARIQGYYAGTRKLSAEFNQEYTATTFGRKSLSGGRLLVAKPGKMRWDYKTPEKKYFISDGTTLWVYEEAAKQAYQQSLSDQILPVAVTFLYGKGDLATEFDAALDADARYGAKGDLVVKLTPKKPDAQYKNLWLVVDPADFHVKESIILEASGNLNHFTFGNLKQNEQAKVPDSLFKFTPPAGVRVIKPEDVAPASPKNE